MPELPSGLRLALSRKALFDHGGNWFDCPEGHFWYWTPDLDINPPPFEPDVEIIQDAKHASVPRNRVEVAKFIQVLEFSEGDQIFWRGEWLSTFPQFTSLNPADRTAWDACLDLDDTKAFLDDAISECQRLAKEGRTASGFPVLTSRRPD